MMRVFANRPDRLQPCMEVTVLGRDDEALRIPQDTSRKAHEWCAHVYVLIQVPESWAEPAAMHSTACLSAWLAQLRGRVRFLARWLTRGMPRPVWLPGLSSPAAFLTALLQRHARTAGLPLERLELAAEVLPAGDGEGGDHGRGRSCTASNAPAAAAFAQVRCRPG